jgi:hypothetical protein
VLGGEEIPQIQANGFDVHALGKMSCAFEFCTHPPCLGYPGVGAKRRRLAMSGTDDTYSRKTWGEKVSKPLHRLWGKYVMFKMNGHFFTNPEYDPP